MSRWLGFPVGGAPGKGRAARAWSGIACASSSSCWPTGSVLKRRGLGQCSYSFKNWPNNAVLHAVGISYVH